jgi:hypothetical protein
MVAKLCAMHGATQGILIFRREGNDGGEGVTTAGLTYRDARIAEEIGKVLKSMIGMKVDTTELDKELAQAAAEMDEGPKGAMDLSQGKLIILPALERKDKVSGKLKGGKRNRSN